MTFFDIFSKKKISEEELEKPKVLIDNREKNSLVPSELVSQGMEIEFQQLPVGDYIINNIAIERKTLSDLKSSIINKRIFIQIQELKQYPKYLLVIEGISEENIYSGPIHENALRGFLLSLTLDFRIPLVFTQNEKDTAKYISLLARKKEKIEVAIRASKISPSKEEQLQFILEGFPYVGPVTAKKLIKKFKSLKNIINAPEQELQEILGKRTVEFKKLVENAIE